MRIYHAWEVDRTQFQFLCTPSNFPRYSKTHFGCSRHRSRFLSLREKTFEPVGTTMATAHAGGKFIENNFPRRARLLALSDHTRTRRYERARIGESIRMRERAAWVTSHACTGRTAPFEYLSVCLRRVAPTRDGNDDRKNPVWKKSITCLENWSRSSPRFR